MAATIVKCQRRLDDEASLSSQGFTETVTYQVWVSEPDATPGDVVLAAYSPPEDDADGNKTMPNYGDPHATQDGITVTNKTATRATDGKQQHKLKWLVTVTYGAPETGGGGGAASPGATENSRNIVIRCTGVESATFTQKSGDGVKIVNAVNDIYPEAQELGLYDRQFQITFECDDVAADAIDAALGKINDDTVTLTLPQGSKTWTRTFAAKTLLLKTWDYDITKPIVRPDVETPPADVWSCNVVLRYRADTWLRKLPQKGHRWKVDGKLTEWHPTAEYLAADGTKLADGSPIVAMDPGVQIEVTENLGDLLATI